MNKLFPIRIHRRDEHFLATTSLEKLADDPDRVNAQLRDFAAAYERAIVTARAALDDAKRDPRERARSYWRTGQRIRDFESALNAAGFYLSAQTVTFARDLGMHVGSLRKVLAFHRRNPDVELLDAGKGWNAYREYRAR